jgi:hypothetical protein
LALCLRDVEIFVQDTWNNNLNPPNDLHYFGSPCDKPFTFHHLTVPQMQKLYQAQLGSQNGTRNQDIVPFFFSTEMNRGVDRRGDDYKSFASTLEQNCHESCLEDEKCTAYTHVWGKCYLKDKIPSASESASSFSGVVVEHYKCNR